MINPPIVERINDVFEKYREIEYFVYLFRYHNNTDHRMVMSKEGFEKLCECSGWKVEKEEKKTFSTLIILLKQDELVLNWD